MWACLITGVMISYVKWLDKVRERAWNLCFSFRTSATEQKIIHKQLFDFQFEFMRIFFSFQKSLFVYSFERICWQTCNWSHFGTRQQTNKHTNNQPTNQQKLTASNETVSLRTFCCCWLNWNRCKFFLGLLLWHSTASRSSSSSSRDGKQKAHIWNYYHKKRSAPSGKARFYACKAEQ